MGVATTVLFTKINAIMPKLADLIMMSFVLYGFIFIVPFLPFSIAVKAAIVPILIGSGEGTWWIGVAIVGKHAVTK